MATAELLDEGGLSGIEREWGELAVECARPGSLPDLLLPWWRHLAPPGALARVVAVREGGRLVGLAPFLIHEGPLGRPAATPPTSSRRWVGPVRRGRPPSGG